MKPCVEKRSLTVGLNAVFHKSVSLVSPRIIALSLPEMPLSYPVMIVLPVKTSLPVG